MILKSRQLDACVRCVLTDAPRRVEGNEPRGEKKDFSDTGLKGGIYIRKGHRNIGG